jgi:hypothetical protein
MAFSRQLRLELYSATLALAEKNTSKTVFCSCRLKKQEPHPGLQHCFGGKRDRGEPLMLNVSVRPQPAAVAAVSALAATAGKTSSDEILVEQIAAGSKPAMQALFARHRTYVLASSARQQ